MHNVCRMNIHIITLDLRKSTIKQTVVVSVVVVIVNTVIVADTNKSGLCGCDDWLTGRHWWLRDCRDVTDEMCCGVLRCVRQGSVGVPFSALCLLWLCLSFFLCMGLFVCLFDPPPLFLSVCIFLFVCILPPFSLSVCLSVCVLSFSFPPSVKAILILYLSFYSFLSVWYFFSLHPSLHPHTHTHMYSLIHTRRFIYINNRHSQIKTNSFTKI